MTGRYLPFYVMILHHLSRNIHICRQVVQQPTRGPIRGVDRTDEPPSLWTEFSHCSCSHFGEKCSSVNTPAVEGRGGVIKLGDGVMEVIN